jgi:hypothetical protein
MKSRSTADSAKMIALQEKVHLLMTQKNEWLQERIYLNSQLDKSRAIENELRTHLEVLLTGSQNDGQSDISAAWNNLANLRQP